MKPFFAAATKGLVVAAVEPSGRYAYEAPRVDTARGGGGASAVLDANGQIRNKKTKKTARRGTDEGMAGLNTKQAANTFKTGGKTYDIYACIV